MYETLKTAVETGKISTEVAEALSLGIYEENKTELTSLRDEAKRHRVEKEEVIKSFDEVKTTRDDLLKKVGDIDKQIETARNEGKSELQSELEKERTAQHDLADRLSVFEKENIGLKISNGISSELGKYQVKKESFEDVSELLRMKATSGENGLMIGDLSIEDGVKDFFENRKSYLEAAGGQGSGSGGQGGSGGNIKADMGGDKTERLSAIQTMIDKKG